MIATLCVVLSLLSIGDVISEGLGEKIAIKHVYFDPTTSLTRERRDGIVIVETSNGSRSKICNDDFTNNDAVVLCRMMGYLDEERAFAVMSSRVSLNNKPVFYSNLSCQGNETTIENCPGFSYKLADPSCQGHQNDVHVFCNSERLYSKKLQFGEISDCDQNAAEIRNGNEKMGLMILKSGNSSFTLCGINNNFGQNEAHLFCKLLCFKNLRSARIISNYHVEGAPIGGFRRMKCPENAVSLNDCSNVYSDDSEMCTPADNIGVACESQSSIPEPKPRIICNNDHMVLEWSSNTFKDIDPEYVNILENGGNCTQVSKTNIEGIVSLTVKLDKCNPIVSGTKESLSFRYGVQRVFPKKNKIVHRNTQNFNAVCSILRKEVVGECCIGLRNIGMDPAGNSLKYVTELQLSTTFDFSTTLTMPYTLKIGTIIYGRISVTNAPQQIQLVLQKCYLYNSEGDIEVLIDDRCAVREDVKINPVSDTVIKFAYKSFAIREENSPLFMKCETSKCGKSEIGCASSCQKA